MIAASESDSSDPAGYADQPPGGHLGGAAISKALALDLEKHNAPYARIAVRKFAASHDRFLILDESVVYHIGA